VNPDQRLLRLDFAVDPRVCRQGENAVQLRLAARPDESGARPVALEKLELQVQYA
jgi:hypothetical protein